MKLIKSTLIPTLSIVWVLSAGFSQNSFAGCCMKSNFKCENTKSADACEKLDEDFISWNGLKVCKKKRFCSAYKIDSLINARPTPEKNLPLRLSTPRPVIKSGNAKEN